MWSKCLDIIKDNIEPEQFNAWFVPIVALEYKDNCLTLQLPSTYYVEHINANYLNLLGATLKRVYGPKVRLFYKYDVVGGEPSSSVTVESEKVSATVSNKVDRSARKDANPFAKRELADIDPQLNPKYTFENYCGSMSNKLAVSIGKAIAADPDCKTFNPLFVFGTTGVGKTHLIQAIGIKIKENRPDTRVLYITARVFESQYTTAVLSNKVNDFINFYQSIDVLIIDDIQEFAGKQGTQNTFYHIFNHLHQNQKQLIMSSDCRPADLDGMIPRLISRFKWGMTVELLKPDYDLRRQVLEMRALQDGLTIPAPVLDYIAQNVTDSIRELEGIVVALLAHATMLDQEITIELASQVIGNAVKVNTKRAITFDIIVETVANFYNLDSDLIYGKSRKREISDARQLIMYLAKNGTQLSSTNIGLRLSRDHATVLHACKQVSQRLSIEKTFRAEVEKIEAQLS